MGSGAERCVATAPLLHRAGHFDAAGRIAGGLALRLVREPGTAADQRAFRLAGTHAAIPLHRRPGTERANPDQLPVGFTRHFDSHIGEYVLDITCAACHTGEIHYTKDGKTRAMRIDGGPAMHAFTDMTRGNFAPELLASLIDTANIPWKFDRFAKKVLGAGYPTPSPSCGPRCARRSGRCSAAARTIRSAGCIR